MDIKDLNTLIQELHGRGDAREHNWVRVREWINAGEYTKAMDWVRGNKYDHDYRDCVAIVCNAIAENYKESKIWVRGHAAAVRKPKVGDQVKIISRRSQYYDQVFRVDSVEILCPEDLILDVNGSLLPFGQHEVVLL